MPSWLEQVDEITHSDRQRDYGSPLLNFTRIALRWSTYLNRKITPLDVAMMMVDVKIARQQQTYKEDNFLDMIGYVSCIDDMDQHMRKLDYEDGIRAFENMTQLDIYELLIELEAMECRKVVNLSFTAPQKSMS